MGNSAFSLTKRKRGLPEKRKRPKPLLWLPIPGRSVPAIWTRFCPEGVTVEVVEHGIPEAERVCDACGTVMEQIGKEVRRTLVLRPATATIREDVYYTYACRKCSVEATETPILKTERIPPVISGSYASPEAIAHIMVQKFVMASPLYRQEQELNRSGIQLSRQTMSNWILRAADDWLTPIYEEMKKRLVKEQILHADETTLQVLKEPGKSAQSKSYMWLYRTGKYASQPMILLSTGPTERTATPRLLSRSSPAGSMRTDTPAITGCRSTSVWLAAGRICAASLARR